MFFDLELIESYGSGIRRAKKAMEDNHSPKLVFEPDNDIDDYTMVTAYINEEYARIHNEELRLNGGKKNSENGKKPIKVNNRENLIIEYISENGYITNSQARELLGLAESTTKRILKDMVDKSLLKVEGERKGTKYLLL